MAESGIGEIVVVGSYTQTAGCCGYIQTAGCREGEYTYRFSVGECGVKGKNPYVPKEIHVNEEKKVIVVKWDDGTETKVTCDAQDNFSVDVGFGMALTMKVFGGKGEFKEKWWKIISRRIRYHHND